MATATYQGDSTYSGSAATASVNVQSWSMTMQSSTSVQIDYHQTLGEVGVDLFSGGVQVSQPPGLSAMIASVPQCDEASANAGTCPAASQIGTATTGAGPGEHPLFVKGKVYLTGAYKGAPFGLSIVVPAVAGPFNLGNVVVRSAISVDRRTAAATVTSDPLPQKLDGGEPSALGLRCRAWLNLRFERSTMSGAGGLACRTRLTASGWFASSRLRRNCGWPVRKSVTFSDWAFTPTLLMSR